MTRFVSLHAVAIALVATLGLAAHAQQTRPDAGAAAPKTTLALLSSGEEPKTRLQLAAEPGAEQTVVIEVAASEEALLNGSPAGSTEQPTVRFVVQTTVKRADDNGQLHYALSIVDGGLADEDSQNPLSQRTKANVQQLLDTSGTMVLNRQGMVESVSMKTKSRGRSSRILSQLERAIHNHLVVPLPDQPVGVGAKWKVTTPKKRYNVPVDDIATYVIKKINDDKVTLEVSVEQAVDPRNLEQARLPQGQGMNVDELSGEGRGTITFSPSHPAVLSATSEYTERMKTSRDTEQMGMITIAHVEQFGVTIEKPAEKSRDEQSKSQRKPTDTSERRRQ